MREQTTLPHEYIYVGREWNPVTQKGNFDKSRAVIDTIFIHSMDGFLNGTTAWFQNPNTVPSAHYGIGLDGRLVQWLPETVTAYHAGVYSWNQRSVSIEHEDNGNNQIVRSDALYEKSAQLVAEISMAHGIPLDREHVKMHRDVKATACPGTLDIDRIIRRAIEIVAAKNNVEVEVPHMLKPSVFANLVSRSTEYEALFKELSLDVSFSPRPGSRQMVHDWIAGKLSEARNSAPAPVVPVNPVTETQPLPPTIPTPNGSSKQAVSVWRTDVTTILKDILGAVRGNRAN
jgi:hypothetical protein